MLFCGMSTVLEDTNVVPRNIGVIFSIYLMTILSSSYGIIMDRAINTPHHRNRVVDGIDETDNHYLKEQIEPIGNLASNDT